MKKFLALLLALVMVLSLAACGNTNPTTTTTNAPDTTPPAPQTSAPETEDPNAEVYIPAPYTAATQEELTSAILEPVFYENENGPTIGVTLLGVIQIGNQYFRDLNNNQTLDTFEDWRLDDQVRADAFAAQLTDKQLAYQLLNEIMYSPASTKTEDVVDENGNPSWAKLFNNATTSAAVESAVEAVTSLDDEGWRNYVIRSNPSVEVGVWFNNALEQYAEYDAIANGGVAIPFLSFTNPIAHGMPGNEGIAAAALGDGNADFVLTDAQYDRTVMWSKGIDAIYGPQIDLVTDPRWSRNNGTYGEREDMLAEIARNYTIGFQNGDQGQVEGSVLLTIKHFPGDGASFNGFESHGEAGRYRVYTTANSLADYQLVPFIAAFEAGAAGVMPGYSQPIIDERIAEQKITYKGETYDIRFGGHGNAFNTDILQTLLRDIIGFEGLINSDTLNASCVHLDGELTTYEATVLFVNAGNEAGCYPASDSATIYEALQNGDVTRETLEAAAAKRALMQIKSGNMDCPYRNLDESKAAIDAIQADIDALAYETNLKSVVLMKNHENVLPLDTAKTVYVQGFNQKGNEDVSGMVAALQAQGYTVTDDYKTADVAYLIVNPTIQPQASSNLAVLDLGEDFETPIFDTEAKITDETAIITTVADMKTFQKVADAVHANGGIVIGEIEASNAWILTEMEPYCDALLGVFSTKDAAVAEVVAGKYNPTGKLPITMVSCAEVIALETTVLGEETWEVCVSPCDVPGYVKDQYIDAEVLAQSPSGSYAYKDADGNVYMSGHGLSYSK